MTPLPLNTDKMCVNDRMSVKQRHKYDIITKITAELIPSLGTANGSKTSMYNAVLLFCPNIEVFIMNIHSSLEKISVQSCKTNFGFAILTSSALHPRGDLCSFFCRQISKSKQKIKHGFHN